jgi:hypothetical protein
LPVNTICTNFSFSLHLINWQYFIVCFHSFIRRNTLWNTIWLFTISIISISFLPKSSIYSFSIMFWRTNFLFMSLIYKLIFLLIIISFSRYVLFWCLYFMIFELLMYKCWWWFNFLLRWLFTFDYLILITISK